MVRLGDICTQITDGSHNPPSGISWSKYLMLSSKNIDDDQITLHEPRFLSEMDYQNENKRTNIVKGDLLMTIVGTVGRVAVVPEQFSGICVQRSVAVLKPKHDIVYNRFLMYQLQNMRSYLEREARGVAQKGIYLKQVSQLPILLPPLGEQRRIAALLDKVSDLIAKRRAQLDKLDLLVKARFVEMFGDPVSNPMRWDTVELSHCLSGIDNGKSLVCDTKSRQGNWPAILKLSAATYGYYQPEENKAMLNENEFVNSAEVQTGDLLFTRKNTPELVGMCAYVYETPDKLMMPDLIFRLNTNETCNRIFLWKLINHDLFRENIKAISSGAAKSMSNISKERLCELKIILPPVGLQQQFADFVRKTDQSKLTIQQSFDKLEKLKKALMQRYLG